MPVIEALVNRCTFDFDRYLQGSRGQGSHRAGAEIINDISGLHFDPSLAEVAAQSDTPLILMHIRGTPETMQKNVHYDSLFSEILLSLKQSIEKAELAGVDPNQIIVIPYWFRQVAPGESSHPAELIGVSGPRKTDSLGTSRKSFIGKILMRRLMNVWRERLLRLRLESLMELISSVPRCGRSTKSDRSCKCHSLGRRS